MAGIELLALDRITWQQVAEDPVLFARQRALTLGAEVDLLRSVGRQTVAMLQRTSSIAPRTGYLAIDRLHTLPEPNASTRILEKTGFKRAGETIDPESGPVWRWERDSAAFLLRGLP